MIISFRRIVVASLLDKGFNFFLEVIAIKGVVPMVLMELTILVPWTFIGVTL